MEKIIFVTGDRKGFDILIQAFLCEFFEEENVELTIKTFGRDNLPREKSQALESIKSFKLNCMRYHQLPKCQIKLWWGGITSKQINLNKKIKTQTKKL